MNSLKESVRQIRISVVLMLVIAGTGVIGFMILENVDLLNALWMTIVTLTTIGYGDIVPHSIAGRIFNLLLILVGIGTFAFAAQAVINLLLSPAIHDLRLQNRIRREIAHLENHFIVCGAGPLVDKIVEVVEQGEAIRQQWWENELERRTHRALAPFLGESPHRTAERIEGALIHSITQTAHRIVPARDRDFHALVVVTDKPTQAAELRERSMRVVVGAPTDDAILHDAGNERAQALMVTLDNDAESLLAVLTARQYNSRMLITTALLDEAMRKRMIRVGANDVILPYEIGGHILNMATLRPAVADFFNHILFSQAEQSATEQLAIQAGSPWIGQPLGSLDLRGQFDTDIIAVMQPDGNFTIAPGPEHILEEGSVLIAVCPLRHSRELNGQCRGGDPAEPWTPTWQRLPFNLRHPHQPLPEEAIPGPEEAQAAIDQLEHHFVICADGRAGHEAVQNLDPARPFVIVTGSEAYSESMRRIGFRVVLGDATHEHVLRQAGIERALSLMVTLESEAESTLAVLTARSISKTLNITAAAYTAPMENKLKRAGADRVAMPLQVAAQFIVLATLRPVVADFFQYVVFNRTAGIETTELYMQDDSPFIGQTLAQAGLAARYDAHVIGIRHADGHFLYAPPADYRMQEHEVMIVVAPMQHADELRVISRGNKTGKLTSIRPKKPVRRQALHRH